MPESDCLTVTGKLTTGWGGVGTYSWNRTEEHTIGPHHVFVFRICSLSGRLKTSHCMNCWLMLRIVFFYGALVYEMLCSIVWFCTELSLHSSFKELLIMSYQALRLQHLLHHERPTFVHGALWVYLARAWWLTVLFAKRRLGDWETVRVQSTCSVWFGLVLWDYCCEGPADPEVRRYIFALGQVRCVCRPKSINKYSTLVHPPVLRARWNHWLLRLLSLVVIVRNGWFTFVHGARCRFYFRSIGWSYGSAALGSWIVYILHFCPGLHSTLWPWHASDAKNN